MAYKAIHLQRGAQNVYITVDSLFEAAFSSTLKEYQRKSLMGWRPLALDTQHLHPETERPSKKKAETTPANSPGVKVFETDELIVVEVELPPITENSLYIEISGDLLIIRGERADARPKGPKKSKPRRPKTVHRYVQLPVVVKPGEVRARLTGNIVRVMIQRHAANDSWSGDHE